MNYLKSKLSDKPRISKQSFKKSKIKMVKSQYANTIHTINGFDDESNKYNSKIINKNVVNKKKYSPKTFSEMMRNQLMSKKRVNHRCICIRKKFYLKANLKTSFEAKTNKENTKMQNYEHCCYTNATKRKLSKNNWTELKVQRKNENISQNVNDKYMQNCKNCCYSQSLNANDNIDSEIKKEHKPVCLSKLTETQEGTISKYTIKDYFAFILVILIVVLYAYFIVKTNLVSWIINTAISQGGSFLRFLIKLKTKIFSFNKYAKKVERTIRSLSTCFKSRFCRYPVEFASSSMMFALNCCVINYVTLLILFLVNVSSLPYLEFIVTAFVSLLL